MTILEAPTSLPPLPTQPSDVPWPTKRWPTGPVPAGVNSAALDSLLSRAFGPDPDLEFGESYATSVVHRGPATPTGGTTALTGGSQKMGGEPSEPAVMSSSGCRVCRNQILSPFDLARPPSPTTKPPTMVRGSDLSLRHCPLTAPRDTGREKGPLTLGSSLQ